MHPIGTAGRRPPLDRDRLERAFRLVERHVVDGRAGYAALAVARADGLIRAAAFGRNGPLDRAPRTAIASITKPILATAVLQQVEAGALVLTEAIAERLPGFRPRPPVGVAGAVEAITPWHVLTHTSGLADLPEEELSGSWPSAAGTYLDRLSRSTLRFAPGTAYAYASDSFFLLAELLRQATGLAHDAYLRRYLFEPLGMAATTFDPSGPGPAPLQVEGQFVLPGTTYEDMLAAFVSLALPGGGLFSTAEDVARFGRAMLLGGTVDGTRVLGGPFVDLMTRHHTADVREHGSGRPAAYGLGWGRPGLGRGSPAGPSSFGHSGITGSMLVVDPDHDIVVVYLRNEWGAATPLAEEAIQAVYAAI